jgi:hypothetical protein
MKKRETRQFEVGMSETVYMALYTPVYIRIHTYIYVCVLSYTVCLTQCGSGAKAIYAVYIRMYTYPYVYAVYVFDIPSLKAQGK